MDEPQQAIVASEQDTISFYDRQIIAARLPDGRIVAAVRAMCEALKLDRPSQLRRIREDETLCDQLVLVRVETEGGSQVVEMLTAWAIPTWLTGIQLGRVAPEKRATILAFKREAADVLYRHFSQRPAQLTPPPDLVPATPITQPEAPERGAPLSAWKTYHEGMVAWIEWQADIETWRGTVEHRLDQVEEITGLIPNILERLGPATLTPEHQRTVQNAINRLHDQTNRSHAALYDDLRQAFHVGTYKDIPEARWDEVARWFRARLTRAGTPDTQQGTLF